MKDINLPKLNTGLLVILLLLMVGNMWWGRRQNGRFQLASSSDDGTFERALDTRTGTLCRTTIFATFASNRAPLPLCSSLK